MANRNYSCTQLELYAVAKAGWASYGRNQASFGIFRPIYSANYGLQRLAEITTAENMPDEQARNSASEVARVNLAARGKVCLDNWQMLKRYIINAFQPQFHKAKLEEAGSTLYEKASGENWEVLNGLNVAGSQFIAVNNTALAANQNMPASFPGNFNNAKNAFATDYTTFLSSESNSRLQADAKIVANNNLHKLLMAMFLDGQEIFKSNPTLAKQFIFDDVLKLISSPGAAGLKGIIINRADNAPLAGVTITIVELNKTVQSVADGSYEFSRIQSGDFTIRFEKAGFTTVQLNAFRIATGTTVTKDVVMTSL